MTKTFTTGRLVIIAALLGAVIFGAVNLIASNTLRGARIDLTQQKLFSLSNGTKMMLGEIVEPIRFRFFMSTGLTREAPQIAAWVAFLASPNAAGENAGFFGIFPCSRVGSENEKFFIFFWF